MTRVTPGAFGDWERYLHRLSQWRYRNCSVLERVLYAVSSPSYEAPPPLPGTVVVADRIIPLTSFYLDQQVHSQVCVAG